MFVVVLAVYHVMSDVLCHICAMLHWPVIQDSICYTDTLCLKL